jgi:YHS domain-containing protein
MKRVVIVIAAVALAASCAQGRRRVSQQPQQVKTIDNVPPLPVVIDPPPTLAEEGPQIKPTVGLAQPDAPPPPTEKDEQVRAALPFAPAIALDPVDGSKVSIRADTPAVVTKTHIYYFDSEENKRLFMANPQQYLKGLFAVKG